MIALGHRSIPPGVRLLIAALPIIGLVIIFRIVSRAIRGSDELERQIRIRAAAHAFAFLIIMLLLKDVLRALGIPGELGPGSGADFQPQLDLMCPLAIAAYAGSYIRACRQVYPLDAPPGNGDRKRPVINPV